MPVRRFLPVFFVVFLLLTGCSVVDVPGAYPPTSRPAYPESRPVIRPQQPPTTSKSKPVVTRPVKEPVSGVKPDEPEQGDNPYDTVPQRSIVTVRPDSAAVRNTSPAVRSLLSQAKTSLLAGRHAAAISKLERALRIEPGNPAIWHQLARAHYQEGKDAQSISMARKSNSYAADGSTLEKKNWQLIKVAAKRSGNIKVLKEAIRYERANP